MTGGACTILLILLTFFASAVSAQQTAQQAAGQVELPLEFYNRLVDTARDPGRPPKEAPAGFALGRAQVGVTVAGERAAEVRVDLEIQVLEDDWVLIPVLPAGTALESALVGGSEVQLLTTPAGLAWSTREAGTHGMTLVYRVDASRSPAGSSLAVPLPAAAAINLTATLPGTGLDVAVIPSAGTRVADSGNATRVTATVPTSRGVQISWRPPATTGHAMSRASYSGQLTGDAVTWTGTYDVELMSDETVTLPLLPRQVTLSRLQVDGEDAAILVEGDRFATRVRGRGLHTVTVGFEVPVTRRDGPPRIELEVPPVPVSRFDLTLPGKKEVTVTPASNVTAASRGGNTVATAHVPLTERVAIHWAEAVPEEIRAETRINAGLYHAAWAEEGVLYLRALADFEVSRGETNALRLEVPPGVMVHRVDSASGAVADWRLSGPEDGTRELTVFLDRQLQDRLLLEVAYDRSLGTSSEVAMPLLRALDAQRQRGMVALLSGRDLTLRPVADGDATRVGENQLPAFVHDAVEHAVAHTYKYVEAPPQMTVQAVAPEREEGRFDARVDTLISLGEVTLESSASVEVLVKSGRILSLELRLPAGVSLLSLTGPSVRDHAVHEDDGGQRIDVDFTQEMEGAFRLDVTYERILGNGDAELEIPALEVPALEVPGAEVEQGRIAVEALSALEVQPAAEEQLTALEISELPQQLILRTTNPILMAYRYVSPPYRLALQVTRHQLVAVQEAAIDRADYRTLFTRDGLAVTTARFQVRNSRKQFLRVKLPAGSEIWSAFVDGRPQKPARTEADGEIWHLIKIIHSTRGFPVELVFQTPDRPLRALGTIAGELPRPEILVTQSRWDVYVPAGVEYGEPRGAMDLVAAETPVSADDLDAEIARLQAGGQVIEPLRLVVPTAGLHFAFEKLYANQSAGAVGFAIPYASGLGSTVGRLLSLFGGGLIWLGVAAFFRRRPRLAAALAATGVVMLALLAGRYQIGAGPALWLSVLVMLGIGLYYGKDWWDRRTVVVAE